MGLGAAHGHQRRVTWTQGRVPESAQGLQTFLAFPVPGLFEKKGGHLLRQLLLWRAAFQHQVEIQVVDAQVEQPEGNRGVFLHREYILEFQPDPALQLAIGRLFHQLANQVVQAVGLDFETQGRGFHVQFRQQAAGGDLDDP
jgi:hypothetical protein